ncbi:MAG TPA: FAD-dependent oxidoreductase [Thermoanaerobaculia bacterium]|nr:FAD-dependent oxidoreductase [Thermoanaerobaculia bacterium]
MDNQTHSLWIATASSPQFGPLRDGTHVDVAIIGAGISGLTAALLLKERGKRVAVIEKNRIAEGESGHTTAHLTEAVDARYHFISRSFSREAARIVADASRGAIEQIATIVDRLSIDCGFRRLPGYLYSETRSHVAELKKEAAAAGEAGVAARFVEEVPLPFPTRGAVLFENQAQFHPRQYLIALASRIPGDGSYLFDGTPVVKIVDGEPCVVETENGRLTADVIFQATDVPISGFTSIFLKDASYRTYAAAYLVEGPHPDGLFWDTFDPYHYTRWQETADGTFLIAGGEDHKVGQETDTDGCFDRLNRYVMEHFGSRPLRYRWSGQVIEPADGLPFIGSAGKIFVSTGYAGQGMTFGTVGGMIVADLITGRPNAWAELFDVTRKHARGAVKDLVMENADYPRRMIVDRVARRNVDTKELLDVKEGEGKIVSLDGRKAAVHRDDGGGLHAVSPVCTHMNCDVAWNQAERTWDCPCHGSRFDVDGGVIHGPARAALQPLDIDEGPAKGAEQDSENWRRERDSNPR